MARSIHIGLLRLLRISDHSLLNESQTQVSGLTKHAYVGQRETI